MHDVTRVYPDPRDQDSQCHTSVSRDIKHSLLLLHFLNGKKKIRALAETTKQVSTASLQPRRLSCCCLDATYLSLVVAGAGAAYTVIWMHQDRLSKKRRPAAALHLPALRAQWRAQRTDERSHGAEQSEVVLQHSSYFSCETYMFVALLSWVRCLVFSFSFTGYHNAQGPENNELR